MALLFKKNEHIPTATFCISALALWNVAQPYKGQVKNFSVDQYGALYETLREFIDTETKNPLVKADFLKRRRQVYSRCRYVLSPKLCKDEG